MVLNVPFEDDANKISTPTSFKSPYAASAKKCKLLLINDGYM